MSFCCEYNCGHEGTFEEVEMHEHACACIGASTARARDSINHPVVSRIATNNEVPLSVFNFGFGAGAAEDEAVLHSKLLADAERVYALDAVMIDDIPCSFWISAAEATVEQQTLLEEYVI